MKKIQEIFTEAEAELATAANTAYSSIVSEAGVTAQIYVAHRLREVTDDLIASNHKLESSISVGLSCTARSCGARS